MKKPAKMIGLAIFSIILIIVIGISLFVNLSPQFGGSITKSQKANYAQSENYNNGKFVNKGGVTINSDFGTFVKILKQYLSPQPNSIPDNDIAVAKIDSIDIVQNQQSTRIFWFGHSTFLLEIIYSK
jgi:hypothetical protein